MFKPEFKLTLLSAAISTFIPLNLADAATGCENSARLMMRSCVAEVREELTATLAACQSESNNAIRKACRSAAQEEVAEARDTCQEQRAARRDACDELNEDRYDDPLVDGSIKFVDPDDIGDTWPNNPYVILQAGHTHVLAAEDEIVVVYATEEIREIQGVPCRVVADVVVEEEYDDEEGEWDYTPIEVTDDWFAQDENSNVYYCGEVAQNFEDGVLRDLDGSFESGLDRAKGGLLTLAMPSPGDIHRQEYFLGEAEDIVQYLDLSASPSEEEGGENEAYPCQGNCLKTFDFAPLEPESTEYKYYLPGTGFVLAVSLEDGEVDEEGRESLVCAGPSLEVLFDDACGIEDPEELMEDLCEFHNEFCEDDEDGQ